MLHFFSKNNYTTVERVGEEAVMTQKKDSSPLSSPDMTGDTSTTDSGGGGCSSTDAGSATMGDTAGHSPLIDNSESERDTMLSLITPRVRTRDSALNSDSDRGDGFFAVSPLRLV